MEKIYEILSRYPEAKGNIIAILRDIQAVYNYLPEDALRYLAKARGIPVAQLYSIATFYRFFELVPKGRHKVCVCLGTACHVKGSPRILEAIKRRLGINEGETTTDMRYSVDAVRCVGACSLAPVVVIDKDTYSGVTPPRVSGILKKYE